MPFGIVSPADVDVNDVWDEDVRLTGDVVVVVVGGGALVAVVDVDVLVVVAALVVPCPPTEIGNKKK